MKSGFGICSPISFLSCSRSLHRMPGSLQIASNFKQRFPCFCYNAVDSVFGILCEQDHLALGNALLWQDCRTFHRRKRTATLRQREVASACTEMAARRALTFRVAMDSETVSGKFTGTILSDGSGVAVKKQSLRERWRSHRSFYSAALRIARIATT